MRGERILLTLRVLQRSAAACNTLIPDFEGNVDFSVCAVTECCRRNSIAITSGTFDVCTATGAYLSTSVVFCMSGHGLFF